MEKVLAICAVGWGIAATCMAAVQNFGEAYVCRLLTGLGGALILPFAFVYHSIANCSLEAGFAPLIQVYLSRFYTRQALGVRVAFWLAMAPMG